MGSEYDFGLDMDAASARVADLLENQEMEHDIHLDGLTNVEVLTLYSALSMGLEEHWETGNEVQFHMLREQAESIQDDAEPLFSELNDITEMVKRNAPEESPQQSEQSWLKGFLRSPFGNLTGAATPQDGIWATSTLMIGVMVAIAMLNFGFVLSGSGSLPYENLIIAGAALIGTVGFAFVMGIAVGRTTDGPSPP